MRGAFFVLLLATSVSVWAQSAPAPATNPAKSTQAKPPADAPPAAASKPLDNPPSGDQSSGGQSSGNQGQAAPNPAPPRSDSVNVSALDDEPGESSSKDDPVDLSPPENDARTHPDSGEAMTEAEPSAGSDVGEFHPWDPHKAAKDVEVGDYYFKRKNYVGAESRYREALHYKDNDAIATYRLAVCLEKMNRPDEALEQYQSYLKILPYGPEAADVKKAIERLKNPASQKAKQ